MPRHPKHDYRHPCTYHITLRKLSSITDFSVITGNPDSWYVYHNTVGKAIEKSINSISKENPKLKVYRYVIMPDHVHMLIRAIEYLDRPLGVYIGKIKVKALQNARISGLALESLFERDFYDRILRLNQSLDLVFQYIRQNPYRLLVRRYYPEYFRRVNNLFVYRQQAWQAYGNMHLLANPFKEAVICHRADAGSDKEKLLEMCWMYAAGNGGVLVSPFISAKEKAIRDKADAIGSKIILISNEAFGEIYKPGGRNFQLCEEGRLLVIAPEKTLPASRSSFLLMNALAEWISAGMDPQAAPR